MKMETIAREEAFLPLGPFYFLRHHTDAIGSGLSRGYFFSIIASYSGIPADVFTGIDT